MKNIINNLIFTLAVVVMFSSCQQAGKNSTGSEYVPDMAHSVAYESNLFGYYYNNRWGTSTDLHKMSSPRLPVQGTMPRGEASSALTLANAGMNSHQGRAIPANGSAPYYYGDNEEDRAKAIAEIIKNPYPITEGGLAKGKELYNVFCATCHGEKGDGAGYLVRDDGGKYPAQPANFLLEEHVLASNGRYYHALMHGRNLMGNYKDKLSYQERWQVIHYIRSLQAGPASLAYNEKENTFRPGIEIPGATIPKPVVSIVVKAEKAEAHADDHKNHGDKH